MKSAIEYFLVVILLVVAVFLLVSYDAASIDSTNARSFHSSAIAQIEAGNFSPSVIAACVSEAQKRGYQLNVNGPLEIQNHKKVAEVILFYDYRVALLNITSDNHEIRGFAR